MKKFGGSVHDDLTTDKDLPCDLARRDFLQQAAAVGAGAALYSVPLVSSARGSESALQKALDNSVGWQGSLRHRHDRQGLGRHLR